MQYDVIRLNGMVLSYSQYGERDKRLVLLTAERGKITAFVHGVRRQNSQLQAATRTFAMGVFELRHSGGAYTLHGSGILRILLSGIRRILFQRKYGWQRSAEFVVCVSESVAAGRDPK